MPLKRKVGTAPGRDFPALHIANWRPQRFSIHAPAAHRLRTVPFNFIIVHLDH
jgi:hypothetical protein